MNQSGKTVRIDAETAAGYEIIGGEAARIRSSVLFLGALLGKMRKAVLPKPGGCAIGKRPIDLHLAALGRLGAVLFLWRGSNYGRREQAALRDDPSWPAKCGCDGEQHISCGAPSRGDAD